MGKKRFSRSRHAFVFFCFVLLTSGSARAYPYGLNVTDIGAESAVLRWHTTEKNVEEFKVHCSGIRHYVTVEKEPQTELDVLTHYVPGSSTDILIGDIQANYNYSCMVSEQLDDSAKVLGSRVSGPFHFATDFLSPEEPRTPEIHQQDNQPTRIDLFPVSSKYGPILGYKLQFHLIIEQAPDGTPILQEEMLVPFGKFAPPSQTVAGQSYEPKSFQLSYNNNSLPTFIIIDDEPLKGALKNNAKYSAVTIAYSKSKRQMELKSDDVLYSTSNPSKPFTGRGRHTFPSSSAAQKSFSARPGQLSIAISIGVVLPLLIICWVTLIGAFLLCREHRLRIQQRKIFTRDDVVEANKLRKAQRQNEMPWLQSPQPAGDLPWLDPQHSSSPSRTTDHSQSTPILSTGSPSQASSHRLSSKSLIQFSPDTHREENPKRQMGFTISEPTKYDISNFHKQSYSGGKHDDPVVGQASGHLTSESYEERPIQTNIHSAFVLPYSTTVDQRESDMRSRSTDACSNNSPLIQSPTRFYSAPDFSSEIDTNNQPRDIGFEESQENSKIPQHSSSSMFLPRGMSSGPQLVVRPRTPQPSPIQSLLAQLSGSGQDQQEDLAPDLELDLCDITLT